MENEVPRHEKIRFRREEITHLGDLPSAAGQGDMMRSPRWRRLLKWSGIGIGSAVALVLVLAMGITLLAMSGAGTQRLQNETEAMIRRLTGADVAATFGPARVSLDSSRFVALELRDVRLAGAGDGGKLIDAGLIRVGVRFLPLLSGNFRLGSATIADARIVAEAWPTKRGPDWTAPMKSGEGLIDPDKVMTALFRLMHRSFDGLDSGGTRRLELENVEVVLPEGARVRRLHIASAVLRRSLSGGLTFAAEASLDSRLFSVEGTATREPASGRIADLQLTVSSPDDTARTELAAGERDAEGNLRRIHRLGAMDIGISAAEGTGEDPSRLALSLSLEEAALDFGDGDAIEGKLNLRTSFTSGGGKIEVEQLAVTTGRSRMEFHGAVGPEPPTAERPDASAYRFELISDRSTLAPLDSPEAAIDLVARLTGRYEPEQRRLSVDKIGVRTGEGEVTGTAAIQFVQDQVPGFSLSLDVPRLSVAHTKQLWPWLAASGARNWVLDNLYGGQVVDSRLRYSVVPGRLGNGVPLSAEEISGFFRVENTRFDTAGTIPPVRDAYGTIDFRGNDIDIALSSGTVFMASGRSVAGSNGTLAVRNANVRPVIGKLELDIAGEAPAVAELATYEPIDGLRHVGLAPDDFSGTVQGHVSAEIPLQAGIDASQLGWRVDLQYSNLALSKPIEGQSLADATGSIVVEPDKALIKGKGRLNGAPAEFDLVEPLKPEGPERRRDISVVLDDAAREALVSGLGMMISGPVKVAVQAETAESRKVEVDLSTARLTVPWVGWSKGAGVAATLTFTMNRAAETMTLSDFALSGPSFSARGEVTLASGNLSRARFSRVRLNRGDDIAVDVRRSGDGFAVSVNGDALDIRPLIKQLKDEGGEGAAKAASAGGKASPITLKAKVGALTGFNGEKLAGAEVDYRGSGSIVQRLVASGTTGSGAKFSLRDVTQNRRRSLEMQSADAGAVLRFLDIYDHVQGGGIRLSLAGAIGGALRGQLVATDFWIVNEPRLRSIVSSAPQGDGRSLNQALRQEIDTSRAQFERGYAVIEKGDGYLHLERGALRGPVIGTTFQGTVYDKRGRMDMTGTFMPAYGINRIFGELPLIGFFLGNGRDRGLIGVTYRLSGSAKSPELQINPLSAIAPGIFRSIFEFQ